MNKMSFFERQHQARRRTKLLVLYFLLAVVLITVAVNALVFGTAKLGGLYSGTLSGWLAGPYWWLVSGVTLLIVIIGSVTRLLQLRSGGQAVADMVGARRIELSTSDPDERRFVNVVEEMSIASGTPVPALYVMDNEGGLNAFVAGFKSTEAVLVVTEGALRSLDRDELQGVVGHEYSHIVNGDMRLNIRLMGILAGILSIGQLGRFLLRSLFHSSGRRSSRSRNNGGIFALGLGLGLFIIGYVGLFFGRLIKAAISRQREYLADASAVQFTRCPTGIAGALWKIRNSTLGSMLLTRHAEDMSHMCFGESVQTSFQNLLATHPPLNERIKAVDPSFLIQRAAERTLEHNRMRSEPPSSAAAAAFAGSIDTPVPTTVESFAASVGNPTAEHVQYAVVLHASIPRPVLEALRDRDAARQPIYALLMVATQESTRRVALALLAHQESPPLAQAVEAFVEPLENIGRRAWLPIIDLAMPALKQLPSAERTRFLGVADKLTRTDRRVTLLEFVLLTLLRKHLSADADHRDVVKYYSFDAVLAEIRVLLSLLAKAGADTAEQSRQSFARALASITQAKLGPARDEDCQVDGLYRIVAKLSALSPLLKEPLINACADCVVHDGVVLPVEAELIRAISESLDCPMPPLLTPAN
jgi:Zn-dependent protease with chaperone function